ncbi:NifB/NifX family molybdenum-iron cluster-binding protein [Thermosyntropha sp.]|uniref:NifB/NifX family molybdenum-iron cluster-binding protein n=1 Tax=Thermosyntropha sp. TaxID=2740820 RepID=UPI0025D86FFF|nr:NifB/NifX family molybdenum-iron cluster-binding protein [Thermosyntropha sp.]MBO8158233.1 NifB/NifX family molybdenum-iron cluster-binding protein [Thermosyntropha sp.]
MKIAVACMGNKVSEHFGHCEDFAVFKVENGQIVAKEVIPNPEHQPGFLPGFLKKQGVDVVITGGMGSRAKELFAEKNIKTVTGVSGEAEEVVQKYLAGNLVSTDETCQHHGEGHGCSH